MSLDPPDKSNDIKAEVHLLPGAKPQKFTDEAELKLTDEIESNKLAFHRDFNPARNRENMRGIITAIIVIAYVACVFGIVAVELYKALKPDVTLDQATASLKSLSDYLSLHLVPIITLVLGFYFGSEKK